MKKILFLGAGFLQGFVISRAHEMGYYALVEDGNPGAVSFNDGDEAINANIFDMEISLAIAKEHAIDGVMAPATDTGALTAAYIADQLNLPGISYPAARRIRNKFEVRSLFHLNKVDDMTQFHEVNSLDEALAIKNQIQFPVIIKPTDGQGSRATYRADNTDQFIEYCQIALENSYVGKAFIEDFIVGKEYGVESFVVNHQVYILGVMEKLMTTPPDYAELGHRLPSGLSSLVENKIKASVTRAIDVLEISDGSVNMDILLVASGDVYIIDVGARMGGNLIGTHIIPSATGYDYVGNAIRLAAGDPVDLPEFNGMVKRVATRIMAPDSGTISHLPPIERIAEETDSTIFFNKKVGEEINLYHTNHDSCGFIVGIGDKIEVVDRQAAEALTRVNQTVGRILNNDRQ